ncbi:MAG: asparaginase [Mesorhizobium sp.]
MTDPVLVEVLRGDLVESVHRGAVAVVDTNGRALLTLGDTDRPVFPRSAVKAIQALPLVESGAANAFGFGERELALACASHAGEPGHTALAASMLAAAGLDRSALECGAHWPSNHAATIALARAGKEPTSLHNNCSGKHAGFLCACRHQGLRLAGYVGYDHPFQAELRAVMEAVTGAPHLAENAAVDGCSIPTYAVPLASLALGFARMATGVGLPPARAAAARRLLSACMAEPWLVAGTGAACTRLMEAAPGRIFAKVGAEGVYCAAVSELGLGVALKCDDGAGRAAETAVAAVLSRLFAGDPTLAARLDALARPPVPSRKGEIVGRIRPAGALLFSAPAASVESAHPIPFDGNVGGPAA